MLLKGKKNIDKYLTPVENKENHSYVNFIRLYAAFKSQNEQLYIYT